MDVLITGVRGYIGSHLAKVLFEKGHRVFGIDVEQENHATVRKYLRGDFNSDIRTDELRYLNQCWDAVVHLAGLISVQDSVSYPSSYYSNNLSGTLNVIDRLQTSHFIFASTASVMDPQNPYAYSKLAAEQVIRELKDDYTIFRFFNVAGSNGEFGQVGQSTHLIRIAAEAAAGIRKGMSIYGTDYDTRDGTTIRDYVHVQDLVGAIAWAVENGPSSNPWEAIASGKNYTTMEVIDTMKSVTGIDFEVSIKDRRVGDPAVITLDKDPYQGLRVEHNLEDMCLSAYNYIKGKTSV